MQHASSSPPAPASVHPQISDWPFAFTRIDAVYEWT